ncbi:flagellar FlbD family protein [bacterium]|nr:flagellar FlbD family protein [bacterium]
MIELSRLDGSKFYINAIHIETVEATPDTVITLFSGKKFVVREKPAQVVGEVVAYQREIAATAPVPLPGAGGHAEPPTPAR